MFLPKRWMGCLLALLIIVLDQWSKYAILSWLQPGDLRMITSWFNWVLVFNPGAAFSFLASQSGWQHYFLIAVGLVASAWLLWMLLKADNNTATTFSLSLVLGGAIGNLIDRFVHGAVVDFIQWHYQHWYWPAFNLADATICVGVGLLIWQNFCGRSGSDRETGI